MVVLYAKKAGENRNMECIARQRALITIEENWSIGAGPGWNYSRYSLFCLPRNCTTAYYMLHFCGTGTSRHNHKT